MYACMYAYAMTAETPRMQDGRKVGNGLTRRTTSTRYVDVGPRYNQYAAYALEPRRHESIVLFVRT